MVILLRRGVAFYSVYSAALWDRNSGADRLTLALRSKARSKPLPSAAPGESQNLNCLLRKGWGASLSPSNARLTWSETFVTKMCDFSFSCQGMCRTRKSGVVASGKPRVRSAMLETTLRHDTTLWD